jgi:poly(3-hydroxybutyrate) depolymerase
MRPIHLMQRRLLAVLIAVLPAVRAFPQAAAPFPAGESTQKLEGLKCTVEMPAGFDVAKEHSLVVILHGFGGTDDGMARSLMHLCKEDFVVVAPKSSGEGWSAPEAGTSRRWCSTRRCVSRAPAGSPRASPAEVSRSTRRR